VRLSEQPADPQGTLASLPLLDAVVRYLALPDQSEANPEVESMVERIRAEIPPSGTRDIVVFCGPLDEPVERAMLSWATLAGTAVVLEPHRHHRVATAAWVRPTVFSGTREEIAVLGWWVEKERRRRWRRGLRLPFGRLRSVLVAGPSALSAEDAEFWEQRGVRVGRVPVDLAIEVEPRARSGRNEASQLWGPPRG
jgi:hypothetical protein